MSQITVRKISPSDIPATAKLHVEAFGPIGENRQNADSQNNHALVAELSDGTIAGYTVYRRADNAVYWNWLSVHSEYLGQGVAHELFATVKDYALTTGCFAIVGETRNRYRKALLFYLSNGFDITGTHIGLDGELMIRVCYAVDSKV